jgi:uncharacterized cupredoxin-like copper-binding protein
MIMSRKEGFKMSVKKRISRLLVLMAIIMVVTTFGSLGVFAQSVIVNEPVKTVNTVEVILNDDFFNPKEITLPKGVSTTLLLKNKGMKVHTFTVKALGIDVELAPGSEKTISVEPKQSGTYELICKYHDQQGMVGKVIVQ